MISFEWLHKKISRKASIVAICVAVAFTIVCLEVSLVIYSSKITGNTPEICQLYLEQNDLVHDHFGKLQEERFLKDESVTLVQDRNAGTVGLYTFRISGTKAKGTLKMIWAREASNGALTVNAINIIDELPVSHPLSEPDPKEIAPQLSGLPGGTLAIFQCRTGFQPVLDSH